MGGSDFPAPPPASSLLTCSRVPASGRPMRGSPWLPHALDVRLDTAWDPGEYPHRTPYRDAHCCLPGGQTRRHSPTRKFSGLNTFKVGSTRDLCTSPAFVPTHRCGCYQPHRKARYWARGTRLPRRDSHPLEHAALPGRTGPFSTFSTFPRAFSTCETSAFVCDAIALAWQEDGRAHYPDAEEILLLFDAGGANAARSLRFKEDLVALAQRMGLRLRIAHTRRIPRNGIPSSIDCSEKSRNHGAALYSIRRRPRYAPPNVPTPTPACGLPRVSRTSCGGRARRVSARSKTMPFVTTTSSGSGTMSSMATGFAHRTYCLFLKSY